MNHFERERHSHAPPVSYHRFSDHFILFSSCPAAVVDLDPALDLEMGSDHSSWNLEMETAEDRQQLEMGNWEGARWGKACSEAVAHCLRGKEGKEGSDHLKTEDC